MRNCGGSAGVVSGLGMGRATAYQVGRGGATGVWQTMAGERGRPRGVRRLVGLLVILALAWCGYWFAASRAAEAVIERITSAVTAHGGTLSWIDQGIGGFPLSLD